AEHGARQLLLVSRRGSEAPGAPELARELEGLGAEVTLAACDVSDRERLAELIDSIPAAHPLRALVHSAPVLPGSLLWSLRPPPRTPSPAPPPPRPSPPGPCTS